MGCISKQPAHPIPRYNIRILGLRDVAAPIRQASVVLSQPVVSTTPSIVNGRDSRPGRAVTGYPSVTSASITSRSAVMTMPLVSGPRNTATIYTTRQPIVPYIIGMAKPMPWFTAK